MKEVVIKERHLLKKWVLIFLITSIIIYAVWFVLFSKTTCENFSCFDSKLKDCKPTIFIGGEGMIYQYEIFKKSKESCFVDVKLLQGDLNRENSDALEGQSMVCEVPLGVAMRPEANIDACHGILKENLQNQIIQKLHSYIAQNLGKINLEILDVPKSLLKESQKNSANQTNSTSN